MRVPSFTFGRAQAYWFGGGELAARDSSITESWLEATLPSAPGCRLPRGRGASSSSSCVGPGCGGAAARRDPAARPYHGGRVCEGVSRLGALSPRQPADPDGHASPAEPVPAGAGDAGREVRPFPYKRGVSGVFPPPPVRSRILLRGGGSGGEGPARRGPAARDGPPGRGHCLLRLPRGTRPGGFARWVFPSLCSWKRRGKQN